MRKSNITLLILVHHLCRNYFILLVCPNRTKNKWSSPAQ